MRHARPNAIRTDVRVRNEDSKLNEKNSHSRNPKLDIPQRFQIDRRPSLLIRWETLSEADARDAEIGGADESDDAYSPRKADTRRELEDDEGKDYAAETAGCACDASGEGSSFVEPLADGGDTGVEEEGGGDAAEDTEGEEELVEFWTKRSARHTRHKSDWLSPVEKLRNISAATIPTDPGIVNALTPYASNTGPTCAPPK